jgi:hypothetical protein
VQASSIARKNHPKWLCFRFQGDGASLPREARRRVTRCRLLDEHPDWLEPPNLVAYYPLGRFDGTCCPCLEHQPPTPYATLQSCSSRLALWRDARKRASFSGSISAGEAIYVEGLGKSPSPGAEKILWEYAWDGGTRVITNAFTVLSQRLYPDVDFDGDVDAVDKALRSSLPPAYGWVASVAESAVGGTRTIACSDARGRTVVVEPIAHGVRITVRKTAGDELEHVWEIANVGGSPGEIAFKRISRRDNVMYRGDGAPYPSPSWACFDNIAQTSGQVLRTDTLDDGPHGVLREERIVRDAAGAILSRDIAESRRFGCGQDATLRQTYHATLGLEPDGEPGLVEDHATYWTDDAHPRRNGRPRLVWGESRPRSYQAWDDEGREILRLDQFDGSEVPWLLANWAAPSDLSDLSDHPGLAAIATVSDYAPLAGDSNPLAALDSVRTESRHLVRDGAATCIGRTWFIHTVGTDTVDRAFATVKTVRARAPDAAFGDPGNAVSTATRFDTDAPGIPLLHRARSRIKSPTATSSVARWRR